jgi:DNA-binding NarL/FixJ family response regulator
VLGEAETGRQAVLLTRELRAAVVVMDIAMPVLNGLDAEGQPNKQIAAEPGVSFKTVNKHRQHFMAKLDFHDTARPHPLRH